MRTALFVWAALAAAISGVAAGQDQKKTDDRPIITVTGCVDGNWLEVKTVDRSGGSTLTGYVTRYRLRGSKSLLKEMTAKYKNHMVEVVGAVRDMGETTHRGKTIQVGSKTTIHTGAKEVPQAPSGTADPELEVTSYKDLKDSCS